MKNLYILQDNARIEQQDEGLRIHTREQGEQSIPIRMVESVMVLGHAQITTQALRLCMEHEIPVHYATRAGKLLGSCLPGQTGMLARRMRQYATYSDEGTRLRFASAFVHGKLAGQLNLLRRYRKRVQEYAKQEHYFLQQQRKLDSVGSIEELMGLEGESTRRYFANFDDILRHTSWTGRSRMPPKDPVNALLSLSYMLMLGHIASVCTAAGFEAGVGYLHAVQSKRPSLACDFLELYRPRIDRFVLRLFNRQEVRDEHFEARDGGVLLRKEHFQDFMQKYDAFRPEGKEISEYVATLHRALKEGRPPVFVEDDLHGRL
ncbi:CRISPR-associated endonuclease Cas1 [Eubacteriales bacterium OttesenSCG-928-A19]|nr:CRISPR-associated endonuclease Cas1 [Eubacteriales bacterium OttesenSCG-928-A19]